MTLGPCAKVRVRCTLIAADGRVWVGENDCRNPQPVCPREPGEGYAKCKSICDQPGHAEEMALAQAGEAARGAVAYVEHKRVCAGCQAALAAAGVREWRLGPPPPMA